ncbi:Outer membrane protein assembly factor BamD [Poriferisphaera corsica]|uniref:Outer membrane protein assembly factor BamD n=1 Tax=Poriferisphaera corsica TaxID=2528020 RepID=A0A517YXD5_9BACT|nr:tetratricopeptide repeat protein [Poriferisphaera corsica]QDU34870.1 Outer membrane protein assembly factor BamD [Poriferisphaera corsica]
MSGSHRERSAANFCYRLRTILRTSLIATCLSATLFATPALLHAQSSAELQQFRFAYKLMQRGETDLAEEAFDQYIDEFPQGDKLGDAMYYRAVLFQHEGKSAEAARVLSRIETTKLVPEGAVNLLKGQVMLDQKWYDDALATLEKVNVAKLKPGAAAAALYLKGRAYRGAGNMQAAAEALRQCANLESKVQVRAMIELSRVLVKLDQTPEAITTLEQSLALNSMEYEAEAARMAGDLSYRIGNYDQAVGFYDLVLKEHQTSDQFGPSVLGMLWSHHAAGRYELVLKKLESTKDLLSEADLGEAYYVAGASSAAADHHEQAVQLLDHALTLVGKGIMEEKVLYRLAVSQFELGWLGEMKTTVAKLKASYKDSDLLTDAMYLIAVAEAEQGDAAAGAAKLTEMIDKGDTNPYYHQAVLRRARLYETNNELDAASADYKRYVQAGSLDNPAVMRAALKYVDLRYQLEDYAEAEAVTQSMLDLRFTDDTTPAMTLEPAIEQEAMFRLMLAQIKLSKLQDAINTLNNLESNHPLHAYRTYGTYYRGLLLMSTGQKTEAIEPLKKASSFETLPTELRTNALRLLGVYYRQLEETDAATQTLASIESLTGKDSLQEDELLFLAEELQDAARQDTNKRERALSYLNLLITSGESDQSQISGGAMARALYMRGQIHQDAGELNEAKDSFAYVIALGKGYDLDAQIDLAVVTAEQGQWEKALSELKDLRSSEASHIAAKSLLESARIWRKIAQQRLLDDQPVSARDARREAEKLLKRMVLLYPYQELNPLPQQGYIELASVVRMLENPDGERELLSEVAEKYPESEYATYAKALLAERLGKLGDAQVFTARIANTSDPYLAARVQLLTGRLGALR